jgi:signal transduction histidine kinase
MATDSESHLKQACQYTGARWAAIVRREDSRWAVYAAYHLSNTGKQSLDQELQTVSTADWLKQVPRGKAAPSLRLGKSSGLGVARLYGFRLGAGEVLLVGADRQAASAGKFWQIAAGWLVAAGERGREAGAGGLGSHLELVHSIIRRVIDLGNRRLVAQVAASLLTQDEAYEWAAVILASGDETGSPLVYRGSGSRAARDTDLEEAGSLKNGPTGDVFRTGESLLVNDLSGENRFHETHAGREGSELCVPMRLGGSVLGLVDVRSTVPNAFSSDDVSALETLATALAAILSRISQYEHLEATIHQLRVAQEEAGARLAAHQDAESRLVQAAKLVAVGEMAAGIAHELNNPLTTVTGFAELVLDEVPPEASYRQDVEMVLHEARRARNVVRRLLDFARQGEPSRARGDINEILEDVLALTTNFIHTNAVQLEVALTKDLPWISMDSNQMKQVFINLVHNALHAMPSGGRLRVSSEALQRDERNWIVVRVADNGIGIDAKDIARIFEPFFTTRAARGGTGLGLSVTYGIVTDHGGTIEVESQPGSGSVFSVWLPI